MTAIEIAHDIQARKTESGVWQIKHPGRDGRPTNWYSSGIKGTERDLRKHVKSAKLEDIVALGKRNALTESTLAQFTRGTSKRMTLEGVREEWKEFMEKVGKAPRSIETCLNYYDMWLRDMKLGKLSPMEITLDHIYPFVNPVDSPLKVKTRQIRLFAIRTLFQYLLANNYCAGNPAAIVKVRKGKEILKHVQQEVKHIEAFTKPEFRRLIKHFTSEILYLEKLIRDEKHDPKIHKPNARLDWMRFFRFASIMSWEIGLRLGDICQLEWMCFASGGEVIVHTDKRDTRIAVPMTDTMKAAFEQLPTGDIDYLFPVQRELILSKSRSRPSEYFKKELNACEIEGKSFHALRHTCIRRMKKELEDGADLTSDEILEQIGRVVAHANITTTKGYL